MHKTEAKPPPEVKFEFEPVPEAVTFRPSLDEFADPLTYINQIRPTAEAYGICKIIPPKTWRPPFCLDMNEFKFTPRVQRLNELEANTRIKLNFLEKLSNFWELQGHKFRIPVLERTSVDLYKLYKTVEDMGGVEAVTANKQWSQLVRKLEFKEPTSARILKIHYENILYPYLLFEAGVSLPTKTEVVDEGVDATAYSSLDEEFVAPSRKKSKKSGGKRAQVWTYTVFNNN